MTSAHHPTPARVATLADADAIASTITSAFFHDPVWGSMFPSEQQRAAQSATMWRLYVTSALRYPWTLISPNAEAAAVWIPPGGSEVTEQEAEGLEQLLTDAAGRESARAIMAVYDQLDAAHPSEPCYYLSLLGVHNDHRGKGLGMALLAENLTRIDALGMPTYLESSNPANNARYESAGYRARDQLTTAGGHPITTMWRDARPVAPAG